MSIPVTILGGYLGAGKTTLINRLLAKENGQRLAVFVNDFGEINIDAALIESRDDNVVALTNGCVCCSIGDDLGKAVFDLLQSATPTDHIIIEASGAADPSRVAGYAHGDARLEAPYVITIADAETVRTRSKDKFVGKLVQRQIKSGHLIALSKTDLVDDQDAETVRRWVSEMTPAAPVIDAKDLTDLLSREPTETVSDLDHDALPHFTTFSFKTDLAVFRDRFEAVASNLPAEIWRAKGLVTFPDGQYVFQKVGQRWSLSETDRQGPADTALVFISTSPEIDSAGICEKLQSCCDK